MDSEKAGWRFVALSSQWLASVAVLIEGWRQLNMADDMIDALLKTYSDYCDLLRRFRNGVYHFQPEMFDERLLDFPKGGQETLIWVEALFYEFKRFVWEWPDKRVGTQDEREALRSEIEHAIGWLPEDILHAREHRIRSMQREAELCTENEGDSLSPEAVDLLAAVAEADAMLARLVKSPLLKLLTRLDSGR